MNLIRETWRGLIERRLWPFALVLLIALIAIPVVFGKSESSTQPATPPSVAPGTQVAGVDTDVVVVEDRAKASDQPVTVGTKKNPFLPSAAPAPTATPTPASAPPSAPSPSQSPPTPPSASPTPSPQPGGSNENNGSNQNPGSDDEGSAARYTVTVRWGLADAESVTPRKIQPIAILRASEQPAATLTSVVSDGTKASFLIDSAFAVQTSRGLCRPSKTRCQILALEREESAILSATVNNQLQSFRLTVDRITRNRVAFTGKATTAKSERKRGEQVIVQSLPFD